MLKEHNILRIGTPQGGMKLEVNWSDKEDIKDCKRIRIIPDEGKPFVIKKEELHSIMFAIGNPEEQMKMIPQVQTTNRHYETVVSVKAKKRIEAGQEITFPISLTLPTFEEEIIAEAKKDLLKTHDGVTLIT